MVLDDINWRLDQVKAMDIDHEERIQLMEHTELVNTSVIKSTLVTPQQYESIWNQVLGIEGTIQ